ncbi:hypothetical protein KR009_012175, partial [Drosophila setifemur]
RQRILLKQTNCVYSGISAADDPKPCKYGDGGCILQLCNKIFSERASEEDPSLNLKPLDPLKVDRMVISQGGNSAVGINLTFTDNFLYGLKDARVVKVKGFGSDLKAMHEVRIITKTLNLVGPYDIIGKVLILPISGSGQSNITVVNVKVIIRISGQPLEKHGETYLDVTDVNVSLKPEATYYHFSNLFNGDKALGDNMNAFLNENSKAIQKETGPPIEKAFSTLYLGIIKNVFSSRPYAKFFAEE